MIPSTASGSPRTGFHDALHVPEQLAAVLCRALDRDVPGLSIALVEGDLVRPDGEFVDSRKAAKHSSLIKIRENFIPEMLKSVEAI